MGGAPGAAAPPGASSTLRVLTPKPLELEAAAAAAAAAWWCARMREFLL